MLLYVQRDIEWQAGSGNREVVMSLSIDEAVTSQIEFKRRMRDTGKTMRAHCLCSLSSNVTLVAAVAGSRTLMDLVGQKPADPEADRQDGTN